MNGSNPKSPQSLSVHELVGRDSQRYLRALEKVVRYDTDHEVQTLLREISAYNVMDDYMKSRLIDKNPLIDSNFALSQNDIRKSVSELLSRIDTIAKEMGIDFNSAEHKA